jgi:hypothetical protein
VVDWSAEAEVGEELQALRLSSTKHALQSDTGSSDTHAGHHPALVVAPLSRSAFEKSMPDRTSDPSDVTWSDNTRIIIQRDAPARSLGACRRRCCGCPPRRTAGKGDRPAWWRCPAADVAPRPPPSLPINGQDPLLDARQAFVTIMACWSGHFAPHGCNVAKGLDYDPLANVYIRTRGWT